MYSYEELAQLYLRYRKQSRMMAALVDSSRAEEFFVRAGGGVQCEHCGLDYIDHPQSQANGLFLLCNGTWVHL